ncbi:heavy-metal-associated domain-containing protein [Endothiovibrio diazotrophicus]
MTITVKGMSCGGCVSGVEKALRALPGVAGVEVSLEGASATVDYDEAAVGLEQLKGAVVEAGFETE